MAVRNAFGGNFLQLRGFRPKNASFFHPKPSFRPRASYASFPRAKRNPGPQMKAPYQPVFCSLCGTTLNSEFQTQEHFRGKAHLSRLELSGAGSQSVDSGLNQFAATQADTVRNKVHQHFRGQLRPTKRAAEIVLFNPRPKIPKRLPNATTQYRCTLPYLSKELQYKTPLAMLYEFKNGLVINVSNRQGTSHDPLYTASVELDGKMFRAIEHSKRKAQQQLAEIVISQMEYEIEQMLEKRAAAKQSLQNMFENGEQPSLSDRKQVQILTPSSAAVQGNCETVDFTSNDDLYCSATFNAFHSTTDIPASNAEVVSSGISQPEAAYTMLGSGSDNADSYRTLSGPEKNKLASTDLIASTSDVKPDPKNIITDDTVIASGSKSLISTRNDTARESAVQKTAFATLKFLRPGLRWIVKIRSTESSSEEFDVFMYVDGETFTGCSSVKLLARQYAAEAALIKLFSLECEHGLDGMPLFKGSFDEIAHLVETKDDDSSLNVDGKNPISLLHELFNNETVFQFHSQEASDWGPQHCCTVTVAGMTVEGHDTVKKTAKKRAAFAAISALKANGLYDQRVAKAEARHALVSGQQPVMKYGSVSSQSKMQSKGGTPLLPTPEIPPIGIHPTTEFSRQSEAQNMKGRNYGVRGKTFLGKGRQIKPAQANAAQNAVQPRGRGRGRGRGGTVRGNNTRNNFLHVNSSFCDPGIVGNSTFEISMPQKGASLNNLMQSSVAHRALPVRGRGRGRGRGSASSGIGRGNGIPNVGGYNFDTGNVEIGAFGHCTPHPHGQVRPMASRITFVGSRGRVVPGRGVPGRGVPGTTNNINSRLQALSHDARSAESRVSEFYPAVNENEYEFSSFGPSFDANDPYDSRAMQYSFSGPPCHISAVPRPRLEPFGFGRARVRGPGWGRGFRFNAAVIDHSTSVYVSRFPNAGAI